MIRTQQEPFEAGTELARLKKRKANVGGTVIFIGTVRDLSDEEDVTEMTLEHYPGMTERALNEIETEARRRWPVDDVLIIHRYGTLRPGEDIVLVIVTSAHRGGAFEACHFLIDWLKTKAPFWKLEKGSSGARWVKAKTGDDEAAARWDRNQPEIAD